MADAMLSQLIGGLVFRMRILLCDNLTRHGAAHEAVLTALERCYSPKHETERVLVPYSDEYRLSANQMLSMRLISVADRADAIICLSAPSYLIPHPRKIIWLCGEPASLALNSKSPKWLVRPLQYGWKEAIASYVADRKSHQYLHSLGMHSEYLGLPKPSGNLESPDWINTANTLLSLPKMAKAK